MGYNSIADNMRLSSFV